MHAEPQEQHRWLHRLVGDWQYEAEALMGPDQPPFKAAGRERVRSLGGLWIVAEGEGEMPGGGTGLSIMTLGWDARTGRYVGNWVGSMMTHMFVYDGEMDAQNKVLTLAAEGPSFAPGATALARYRDVIALESDDRRTLTSHLLGDDGQWQQFMTAHYRRVG